MLYALFTIGNYTVTTVDLIVAAVCVVGLISFLIFIIHDMKKNPGGVKSSDKSRKGGAAVSSAETKDALYPEEAGKGKNKKQKNKVGKEEKAAKKQSDVLSDSDPVVALLGFDPYSQPEEETCEITEEFHDSDQETEDMRVLREKMKTAAGIEKKISVLKSRGEKVRYELDKASRYLRDNRVVIASAETVEQKLRAELVALTADKKTAKRNKETVLRVSGELDNSVRTAEELKKNVAARSNDEKLLKEAYSYLMAEVARSERDLSFVNSDIDRLNESVGAELKRIENDNRARALMTKYAELKPLLVDANSSYRAITKTDVQLNEVHAQKHELRQKLDGLMNELKTAYGVAETQLLSQKVSELNKKMIVLDAREEELIAAKENKIAEYKAAKSKANEFLDREKYDLEDIVVAEDKVIGELEYDQLKSEYEQKKNETAARYAEAQKKYDSVISRKVKFKKNQESEKRVYEEEIQSALKALKAARQESEKAAADFDRILPSLSPMSLVTSGSGVISRERTSKRASAGVQKDLLAAERVRKDVNLENTVSSVKTSSSEVYSAGYDKEPKDFINEVPVYPPRRNDNLPATPTSVQLRRLMERLNELERIALREKEQRALIRREQDFAAPAVNKIERRKAQVVAMRKNLKYIDSPRAAREFRHRLYQLSISLDEDEMNDNVLSELIRRTMADAAYLGDKAMEKRGRDPYGDR